MTIEPLRPGSRLYVSLPPKRILAPGSLDQQLVVTAIFDNGTTRDVTRQAAYDISDPTRVEVSVDGQRSCPRSVRDRHRRALHEGPRDQPPRVRRRIGPVSSGAERNRGGRSIRSCSPS